MATRAPVDHKLLLNTIPVRFVDGNGDEAFAELKAITRAGVAVWFYADRSKFEYGTFASHTMAFLKSELAAEFRRTIADKTRESHRRKWELNHVTGGSVFGYNNVRVQSHTERCINEDEATIVRRVFELAAAGVGQKRIAMQLNEEGARAPRAQRQRPQAWAPSSVHEVLFRELYRGRSVWMRTRKRDESGEKNPTDRPRAEWCEKDVPEWRIVPEDLWQAAHARIAEARALYHDATKGLRGGRPHRIPLSAARARTLHLVRRRPTGAHRQPRHRVEPLARLRLRLQLVSEPR